MSITSADRPSTPTDAEKHLPAEHSVLSTVRGRVVAGLLAVALLGTGGFALTHLGGDSAGSAANAAAGPGGAGPGGANGFTPPTWGTITAVSASSVTVKTSSGTSTYKVTGSTEVQDNGATSKAADLTVGEAVVVFTGSAPGAAASSGSADTANRIMAGSSATAGPGAGSAAGTTT